jgi:hypothetical protein
MTKTKNQNDLPIKKKGKTKKAIKEEQREELQ